MKHQRWFFLLVFLVFFFIFAIDEAPRANLHSSVIKYKDKGVSQDDIKKLSRYDHLIRYFSNFSYFIPRHKVSPDFIRALILAESGANPQAMSNKNALGLGQILLTTGKEAAKKLAQSKTDFRFVSREKLENLGEKDLFDPAINILITCYLVAKYNYRFDGKLELVISAWNAGEYTKSLTRGRHAPYRETENLIGKVNAYYVYLQKHRTFP
ncbi:MAG: lytic transglycosylase domain-containing protein [Desulfobulbaceae bacterium]|nr:lytic transglycosylase domain-containing protein [Desulfobulbaceae bacterium]